MNDQEKESRQREKGIITALRSGNKNAIFSALKEIRIQGSEAILYELIDLLATQDDEQVKLEICTLLNDLKSEDAIPVLVGAVDSSDYASVRKEIAAACWQNGLSYHKQLMTFVNVMLKDEYSVAIEAFTVIENTIGDLEQEALDKYIAYLKENLQNTDENKKPLIRELIRVMESY